MMDMARPVTSALSVPIKVGGATWRMHVHGAVCRNNRWIVDLVLVGPQTHTLSVSTVAGQEPEIAAQAVISVVREWLLSENQNEKKES
jgi:hypothetical protein